MEYLGAWGTQVHQNNLKLKTSCQTPFKRFWRTWNIYARIRQWIILYDTVSTWCNIPGIQIIKCTLPFFTTASTFFACFLEFSPIYLFSKPSNFLPKPAELNTKPAGYVHEPATNGDATYRSCTQRKHYRTCMLRNVAAHNVSIRNIKVSKRKHHITYSVTKCTSLQNVKCTLSKCYKTFCNCIFCDTLYVMWHLRFENFTFWNSYVVCSYVL